MVPARDHTLGAMATRLRRTAGHLARGPVANAKALAATLNTIADDLDWFDDAYQRRESQLMKGHP